MVAGGGLRRVEEEVEIICGTINVHVYLVKLKICVNNVHFYEVKLEAQESPGDAISSCLAWESPGEPRKKPGEATKA